ncbi:hypothetical protein BB561_001658 [Smittium simulii]|uniref:Inositol polyphosphate-related phosphatase domain-containing protein n=1 Tax=Smittium simulii TaxID=133385 RepID=A0A2T9YTM7_9FUNG|nr:hypothetical protein BB561_001658 [Smittium simulii]
MSNLVAFELRDPKCAPITASYAYANTKPPSIGIDPLYQGNREASLKKTSLSAAANQEDEEAKLDLQLTLGNTSNMLSPKLVTASGHYISIARKRTVKTFLIENGELLSSHKLVDTSIDNDSNKSSPTLKPQFCSISVLPIASDPEKQGLYFLCGCTDGKIYLFDGFSTSNFFEVGCEAPNIAPVIRLIPGRVGQVWSFRASGLVELWDFGLYPQNLDLNMTTSSSFTTSPFPIPNTPTITTQMPIDIMSKCTNENKLKLVVVNNNEVWVAALSSVYIFKANSLYSLSPSRPMDAYLIKNLVIDDPTTSITSMSHGSDFGAVEADFQVVWLGLDNGTLLGISTVTKQNVYDICLSAEFSRKEKDSIRITAIGCISNSSIWIGFGSGYIVALDLQSINSGKCTAMKKWLAHSSPVFSIIVDHWALLSTRRCLQVISIHDNTACFWDGLLAQDWIYNQLRNHSDSYCQYNDWDVRVLSWNAGATKPSEIYKADRTYDATFLRHWISDNPKLFGAENSTNKAPDMIVVNLQEVIDLESKRANAKVLWNIKTSIKSISQAKISTRCKQWVSELLSVINSIYPNEKFALVESKDLVGLFICAFVQSAHLHRIHSIGFTDAKTGLGGLYGNKGAVSVRFIVDDTAFCFINAHLTAGEKSSSVTSRNNDCNVIMKSLGFSACPSEYQALGILPPTLPIWFQSIVEDFSNVLLDSFIGGGNGGCVFDYPACVFAGDLNYRINKYSQEQTIKIIEEKKLSHLLLSDQLTSQLGSYAESRYDTSEKRRIPAWCDRILFRKTLFDPIPEFQMLNPFVEVTSINTNIAHDNNFPVEFGTIGAVDIIANSENRKYNETGMVHKDFTIIE